MRRSLTLLVAAVPVLATGVFVHARGWPPWSRSATYRVAGIEQVSVTIPSGWSSESRAYQVVLTDPGGTVNISIDQGISCGLGSFPPAPGPSPGLHFSGRSLDWDGCMEGWTVSKDEHLCLCVRGPLGDIDGERGDIQAILDSMR